MPDKTAAERNKRKRQRFRELGLIKVEVYVLPEDKARIKDIERWSQEWAKKQAPPPERNPTGRPAAAGEINEQ